MRDVKLAGPAGSDPDLRFASKKIPDFMMQKLQEKIKKDSQFKQFRVIKFSFPDVYQPVTSCPAPAVLLPPKPDPKAPASPSDAKEILKKDAIPSKKSQEQISS